MSESHRLGRAGSAVPAWFLTALGLASAACAPAAGPSVDRRTAALSGAGSLDLLFMIDDGPGMAGMQGKLADQIPLMMQALASLPRGVPDLHVAIISSDMGAHSDVPDQTGCSETGDEGLFQALPQGTCTDTTLAQGAKFISDSPGDVNYTSGDLATVLQCLLPLGEGGCQFEHPLASIARALGADGMPAPTANAGFLRSDAILAIVILTRQDDCSAASPEMTLLYSLNGEADDLSNRYGPLTPYRCNEFGHLCVDPGGNNLAEQPPESTPPDADGTPSAPTLNLATCTSNEMGLLTPVGTFVDEIRTLKPDPDHQIVVSMVAAPPSPYAVAWFPAPSDSAAAQGEFWPQVEHSCGALGATGTNPQATSLATDGSSGDPSVRLTEFVQAFGTNGLTASICDGSYGTLARPLATLIADNLSLISSRIDGDAGIAALDGSASGDAGWFPTSGSGGAGHPGSGGAAGEPGYIAQGGHPVTDGLHGGCSVGASAAPGSSLVSLLVALAIGWRRARRTRKNLT